MRRCEVCFAPLPSWAEAYLWPCVRGGLTVCADCFDTLVSGLSRRELAARRYAATDEVLLDLEALPAALEAVVTFPPHPPRCAQRLLLEEKASPYGDA